MSAKALRAALKAAKSHLDALEWMKAEAESRRALEEDPKSYIGFVPLSCEEMTNRSCALTVTVMTGNL